MAGWHEDFEDEPSVEERYPDVDVEECEMDTWIVYVELDGQEIWTATYGDIGAAQMAAESMRLKYFYYHDRATVGIVQV